MAVLHNENRQGGKIKLCQLDTYVKNQKRESIGLKEVLTALNVSYAVHILLKLDVLNAINLLFS